MKKTVLIPIVLSLIVAVNLACALLANAHTESDPWIEDLNMGRKLVDVGDVIVWNDGTHLYVKYYLNWEWYVTEIHLHVATCITEIPQKNGNPIPGHFDFKYEFASPEHEPEPIAIELGSWTQGTLLYVAAHALVVHMVCGNGIDQCETAWGGYYCFPGKNWATYFQYTVQ
jgi:hypothetical protein